MDGKHHPAPEAVVQLTLVISDGQAGLFQVLFFMPRTCSTLDQGIPYIRRIAHLEFL
ncbi:hypothetical protein D3C87_1163300 [compost metagenome]